MGLPFEPEGIASLRARFPDAFRDIFAIDTIRLGTQMRAGQRRSNVFDFEDGIRLILGREDNGPTDDPEVAYGIHISASVKDGFPEFQRFLDVAARHGIDALEQEFRDSTERHYRALSDDHRPLKLIGFLSSSGRPRSGRGGIPHFFIPEPRP